VGFITITVLLVSVVFFVTFRDTLNRIQYIEFLRIYWITRDNGKSGDPFVVRSFMRQIAPPWWRGKGIQFRVSKYTFQVGILREKANVPEGSMDSEMMGLLSQLDGRELDIDPKVLRDEWT
jgi:hypothetical protein